MNSVRITFIGILLVAISCKTKRYVAYNTTLKTFEFIYPRDTINLVVKYFSKNSPYCYTEVIPYALIIRETNNSNLNIPKIISVLAKCDNNNYRIGQNLKIVPIEDPTNKADLKPLYITRDTIVNKTKYHWLIGAEYPAFWGKVIQEAVSTSNQSFSN